MNARTFLASIAAAAAFQAVADEAPSAKIELSQPAGAQTGTFSRPKSEPYVDDATGVEFPVKVAGLVKTQVVRNANPYYGTVVRYASADGSCADVYIYSLGQTPDGDALKAHFQGVMKVIAKLPAGNGPVRSLSMKGEKEVKLGSGGSIPGWKAAFSFEASEGSVFDSELLLFAFKDKVVKIRVSHPAGTNVAAGPFEREIAKLFEAASKSNR